jgi:two-component system chemotaxis response regulator CheB
MTQRAAQEPIRVLTVDDSTVIRGFLGRIIDAEPDMRVVATAMNGQVALNVLDRREVDIILLDIEMPEMDGLTALPLILKKAPNVRVIMASSLTEKGAEVTIRALSLGAADYVTKPSARHSQGLEPVARDLVGKIRVLAGRVDPMAAPPRADHAVPADTAHATRGPAVSSAPAAGNPGTPGSPTPTGTVHSGGAAAGSPSGPGDSPARATALRAATSSANVWGNGMEPAPARFRASGAPARVLGIASSTGGPNALATFFEQLPGDFDLPILVTQHMPALFTAMLAERLAKVSGRPACEGRDGMRVEPGHIYVAPGDYHMVVASEGGHEVIRINQDPPENFCRPAADPLFRSLSAVYGAAVTAVVLTGMGHDGMLGAETIAEAGGTVIAQDRESSVVWGMPRAVATAGIAHHVLPLDRIAGTVASRMGALR